MATTNANRDVSLTVGIKTSGEEALRNLASEVQNLAKRGGDAAPAYEQLANELNRLAQQAAQLDAFKTLAADVGRLSEEQRLAATSASDLAAQLERARQATAEASATEAQAQAALKTTRDALAGKRFELAQLNIDTDRAGKQEQEYLDKSRSLRQEILNLSESVRGRREAMRAATQEVDKAEAAEAKLAAQYDRSAKAAGQIGDALAAQREAMTRTAAAAEQLGLSVKDVTAAEEKLLATQQRMVSGVADARIAAARQQAEADRLAIIEQQALAELYERGRVALQAETAAINEAAEASKRYAAFQRDVALEVRRLEEAQESATRAMRESAAAATKANEEALQAAANADRIRFYAQAFDELAAKERKAAEEAEHLRTASDRAAAALKEAFGQTGVRGLQAIEAEISKVGASLEYLEAQFKAGAIGAQDLARATSSAQVRLAQLNAEARNMPALPGQFERMSTAINGLISRFGALGAAIATVGVAVKPVIDATTQLERMDRVLTSVTGSSTVAAQQIEFARNAAQRAGQAFGSAGEAYSKFAAAALNSGVPLATVQKVFEATALAAGNLGLSSDETGRILGALSQVASKGVVQMEELRGQLGDALPGALSLMAKGLGLTEVELNKLVESGGLLARDALPALADALTQLGPKGSQGVTGLIAEFNRLKNVVLEASTIVTNGAIGQAAGAVLSGIAAVVERISLRVSQVSEGFTVMGQTIGAVTAAVVNRDFKLLGDELDRIGSESVARLEALESRIEGTGAAAAGATSGVQSLGSAFSQAAREIGGVDAAQKAAATSAGSAGTAASAAAASWVQLSVRLAENMDAAVKAAVVADKLADAKRAEADATAAVLAVAGDELLSRQAAARGAQAQAAALDALAAADARVADVARQGIDQLEAKARAENRLDEATKKTLQTLRETLASKEADAEKSRQQAEAARAHALALDVEAKAMLDNSGKVALYRLEVERAASALASATERLQRDRATKEEVQRATEALARAEGLLRDAVSDRARAAESAIEVAKLDHQIKRAGIQLQIEESRAAEILARARGDEVAAAREALKQKELQILISRDVVAQTVEEAQMRKQAAEEELADTANLTPEKERELRLRIKNAEAKIAEAKAGEAAVKVIVAEKDALEKRNAAASAGIGNSRVTGGTGSGVGAPYSTNRGPNQTAGVIDGSGMGSFAGSVKTGSGLMAGQGGGAVDASYVFDLWARFQQGRVSPDELPAIRNALAVAENNARLGGPGSVSFEGKADDQMWIGRLKQIIDAINVLPSGDGFSAGGSSGRSPASATVAPTSLPTSAAPTPTTRTLRIEMSDGWSTSINTASNADASNLEALIDRLAQLSKRSA